MTPPTDAALVTRLRRGLLALTAAVAAGTTVELAMHRHWNDLLQAVPFAGLAVVAAGAAVAAAGRGRAALVTGRVAALVVAAVGVFGVYEHVTSNYEAGPLDFRYTERWPAMSEPERWWAAATGEVGPSPPLAPGILALAGACLGLALMGRAPLHPGARDHEHSVATGEPGERAAPATR